MAYEKQEFSSGNILHASELNHIEDGIVALEEELNTVKQELAKLLVAEGASF